MGYFYFLFPVLTDKTKDYLCIFAKQIHNGAYRFTQIIRSLNLCEFV